MAPRVFSMKMAWLRAVAPLIPLLFGLHGNAATPPDQTPSPVPEVASATTGPTIEQVQAKLATLTALRDLSDSERTQAQELYQQAIRHLEAARNHADSAAAFQRLQRTAPAETTRLQQTLTEELPPAPSPALSSEELSEQLTQTQLGLNDAQKRLSDLDQQLTGQQARFKSIPIELGGLKQQIAELDAKLQITGAAATTPLLAEARLLVLNAQRQALNQQLTMLEQEQLSYDARFALLNAQRAVTAQEVARAQTRAQQLQDLLNARRRDEAAEAVQQTTQATREAAAEPEVVQTVAALNATISRRLAELVQQSDEVSARQAQVGERLAQLTERVRGVRQQLGRHRRLQRRHRPDFVGRTAQPAGCAPVPA